jgi:hypothetical protein
MPELAPRSILPTNHHRAADPAPPTTSTARTARYCTEPPPRPPPRPACPHTDRTSDTHDRVRTDIIGHNGVITLRVHGRLHHIGIGRTRALLLIQDLHVRVIAAEPANSCTNSPSTPTPTTNPHHQNQS